jgi:hypothetical protein
MAPPVNSTVVWLCLSMNSRGSKLAALLLAIAVIACSHTSSSPSKPEPPRINAVVAYDRRGVSVTNGDRSRSMRSVELKLNMKQWGENSGVASAGDIAPGKTVVIPFSQFIDSDLHRFNIATTALLTVFVKAQIEPGEQSSALFLCPNEFCQRAPDK